MFGLFDKPIKVDFEDKVIKIKDVGSPGAVAELIRKEFTMRSADAPIELVISEDRVTLKLINGWKFDSKTISIMKQKDDRRYKRFRKSDTTSVSSEFKRT
jgi:hypothetical protein